MQIRIESAISSGLLLKIKKLYNKQKERFYLWGWILIQIGMVFPI